MAALVHDVHRIAVLPGSIRTGSMNRRLGHDLAARFADAGAETVFVDLVRFPMPIYHGDDEASSGQPPAAVELHDLLATVDGLVVISPEYNGGMPALLKNAIDWVTRVDRSVFHRHLVGLASTSPGGRGGQTVLAAMQAMFAHMRLEVHGRLLSVPQYGEAFVGDEPHRLVRTDAVEAADEFVRTFTTALADRADRSIVHGA